MITGWWHIQGPGARRGRRACCSQAGRARTTQYMKLVCEIKHRRKDPPKNISAHCAKPCRSCLGPCRPSLPAWRHPVTLLKHKPTLYTVGPCAHHPSHCMPQPYRRAVVHAQRQQGTCMLPHNTQEIPPRPKLMHGLQGVAAPQPQQSACHGPRTCLAMTLPPAKQWGGIHSVSTMQADRSTSQLKVSGDGAQSAAPPLVRCALAGQPGEAGTPTTNTHWPLRHSQKAKDKPTTIH